MNDPVDHALLFSARCALDRAGAPTVSDEGASASDGWRVRWVCNKLAQVEAERDEARAQLAAISDIVGPDMVSRDGAPAVEEDTPVVERVRALRHAASAEAEEADRLRAELAASRRGDSPCIDDDGTPFASARHWRAANSEACKRLEEARNEADRLRAELARLRSEVARVMDGLAAGVVP